MEHVEKLFGDGFVVHPETMSLESQARRLDDAEVIAGFGGSGMFHLAYATRARRAMVIAAQNYPTANESMFCGYRGVDLLVDRYLPEIPKTDRFSSRSFQSSFVANLDSVGSKLDHLLQLG